MHASAAETTEQSHSPGTQMSRSPKLCLKRGTYFNVGKFNRGQYNDRIGGFVKYIPGFPLEYETNTESRNSRIIFPNQMLEKKPELLQTQEQGLGILIQELSPKD